MPPTIWSILVSMPRSFSCTVVCSDVYMTAQGCATIYGVTRKYELKRRAERQQETRRRIVEAAIELHRTKGPARTTLSDIARLAGVQRHTLYRHFPGEREVSVACSGLYFETHRPPDPEPWRTI